MEAQLKLSFCGTLDIERVQKDQLDHKYGPQQRLQLRKFDTIRIRETLF